MSVKKKRLTDIEAIKQLKARYFLYVDTKQWEPLRAIFTDDADFDSARIGEYQMDGPEDFVRYARQGLTGAISVHHGHMPIIEFTGKHSAKGRWAMMDYVQSPDGNGGFRGFIGYGHYHEEYRKVDGEWKICKWAITRLRVDQLAADHPMDMVRRPIP
jgi:hypothetical protein